MNVARHAPTSEAMARIQISNLSESQPMVVPAMMFATLRRVSVNEDCDALRPKDDANATGWRCSQRTFDDGSRYANVLGSHVVGIK